MIIFFLGIIPLHTNLLFNYQSVLFGFPIRYNGCWKRQDMIARIPIKSLLILTLES